MGAQALAQLGGDALLLVLTLATPAALTALLVGLVTAFFQAATGAVDTSVGVVPKVFAVGAALLASGASAHGELAQLWTRVLQAIAHVGR